MRENLRVLYVSFLLFFFLLSKGGGLMMQRFLPLILVIVLFVVRFFLQIFFTWKRWIPLISDLKETYDGSSELAEQANMIILTRKVSQLARALGYLAAILYLFMQPAWLRMAFYVIPAGLLLIEFLLLVLCISNKKLQFLHKPVVWSIGMEMLFALIYLGAFVFFLGMPPVR